MSDGPKENDEEAAREFKTRVRRATAADHNASGASRVVGSINFKLDYAPDFPVVTLGHVRAGGLTTVAALEKAGFLAPRELPHPPPVLPPQPRHTDRKRPPKAGLSAGVNPRTEKGGRKPDRSKADYFWAKYAYERGWTTDEIAAKLPEVSDRARERIRAGNIEKGKFKGYCRVMAENAEKYEQQRKSQRQFLKPSPQPRR